MIERVFHCDLKDCDGHVKTLFSKPEAAGFLTITETGLGCKPLHFCGWDCVLKYAAAFEPPTIIPFGPQAGESA